MLNLLQRSLKEVSDIHEIVFISQIIAMLYDLDAKAKDIIGIKKDTI